MGAENAVEFGAKALDSTAALVVHEVSAELDGDAVEILEGVAEEEQLGLGIEAGTLDALRIPGRADLDAAVGGVDIHISGHADGLTAVRIDDGEGQHIARLLKLEAAMDLGLDIFRPRGGGVPKLPDIAVLHGRDQAVEVIDRERVEFDVLALEGDRLDEFVGHKCKCILVVQAYGDEAWC